MNDSIVAFLIWGVATFVAVRCIMTMSTLLRDRLQGLLVNYVQRQRLDMHKKRRIRELRMKIREKKLRESDVEQRKSESSKAA